MTAHRGQRPRRADPVDGDLRLSESLPDRSYAASLCAGVPCWSSAIRRLRKPRHEVGCLGCCDDGSSGPLGVAAPGGPLVCVVGVDLGLVRG